MKSKCIYLLFVCVFFALCFSSCKKEDVIEEEKPEVLGPLSTISSISFESTKDASLILISTKLKWAVSSNVTWLSFTADNSEGKTGILIGASENTSLPREGIVTITADTMKHTIKIKQAGSPILNVMVNDLTLKMILVEAGTFSMGDGLINTIHDVKVDSFYISETEVSNALWLAVRNSLPYDFISQYNGQNHRSKPNQPVSTVTWINVVDSFLPALKTKTNQKFRLPTEAEWEYAAVGGKKTKGYTYAGSNDLDEVGWNSVNSSNSKKDVKLKKPNELGLYDMSGNVSEWCSDWNGTYSSTLVQNPKGPDTGTERIIRGGDYSTMFFFGVTDCAIKRRSCRIPTTQYDGYGFRLVISL